MFDSIRLPVTTLPSIKGLFQRLGAAYRIHQERRILASLSDAELRDIGIDRSSADAEAARGFFDYPNGR